MSYDNRIGIVRRGHLPNNLTVEKIRLGYSIIRNPVLVSYASKGILPYRALGSGIKRTLDAWSEIDFIDDRDGCLFSARVHRKVKTSSRKMTKTVISKERVGLWGHENKLFASLVFCSNLKVPDPLNWINLRAARVCGHTLPQHSATRRISSPQRDGSESVQTGCSAS